MGWGLAAKMRESASWSVTVQLLRPSGVMWRALAASTMSLRPALQQRPRLRPAPPQRVIKPCICHGYGTQGMRPASPQRSRHHGQATASGSSLAGCMRSLC